MAVYKKKHKKIFSSAPKIKRSYSPKKEKAKEGKIKTTFYGENDSELKIIKGKKLEQKRRIRIGAGLIGFIVILTIIFELSLPIGIGDTLENFFAEMGSGTYPIDTYGTTLIDVKTANGYYYILTDSKLTALNSSGKEIISFAHGYENPIIKKSSTRVLVFEQGGNNAAIFNLSQQKSKIKLENEIVTANISRCGVYAIVTKSEQYASAVVVYDTNDNLIYEWYSAEDIVNNVSVSPDGKKIVVSTVNADGGKFISKVFALEFDSASPVFSKTYEDNVIYSLDTSHNRGFWCVSENFVSFIKWSGFDEKEFTSEYSLSHFIADTGGTVAVFNRVGDKADNKIVYFNKSGDKKSEFDFSGNISDISVRNSHIYCISDNNAFLLNKNGELLKKCECGFGATKMFITGTYEIAAISDNSIEKFKFE